MAFLLSPLSVLLRPTVLPVTMGIGGLFYGCYDITVMTFGSLVGTKHHSECSFSHKFLTFTGGMGASVVGIIARAKFDPAPSIPPIDKELTRNVSSVVKWARTSAHTVRLFPYIWYASSTAAAGVITGMTVSLTR